MLHSAHTPQSARSHRAYAVARTAQNTEALQNVAHKHINSAKENTAQQLQFNGFADGLIALALFMGVTQITRVATCFMRGAIPYTAQYIQPK